MRCRRLPVFGLSNHQSVWPTMFWLSTEAGGWPVFVKGSSMYKLDIGLRTFSGPSMLFSFQSSLAALGFQH